MAGDNPARITRVKDLACCIPGCLAQPVEAHHPTGGGIARKRSDNEAFPLCVYHHREFHDLNGYFKHWNKPKRKEWQAAKVREYQERLGAPDDW